MLAVIRGTHLGIVKCKQRAREALYWPGMSAQIKEKVKDCTICHDYALAQQKEPLIPSAISDVPWAMAASDIFTFESEQFLVLVDYYSKYIEVTKLKDLTSQETIQDSLEFFGYVFSGKNLSADPKKVEAITNPPSPTNVPEVRSLLGMANYCSRFILAYATLTQPLRELTQRDSPWEWSQKHELKTLFSSSKQPLYKPQ